MKNYQTLNEAIVNRTPHKRYEENTYFTNKLYDTFCFDRKGDYKYLAIYGPYRGKYKWTPQQCQAMYDKCPDTWTDFLGIERMFDWGKGENQIVTDRHDQDWHIPELDHIVSRDEGARLGWTQEQIDDPSNMQVLPRIINRMLSNITNDEAQAIIPLIVGQFPNIKLSKS
jgi:hypothetical protein